ncbi:MAG: hypothetical protein IAX21_11610 [Candidatus Bathyarchaeota archaeon]|nr:MAG: hypothetical protein IAX21_11610 [Candidatus Bathyarchaeota archaeon]
MAFFRFKWLLILEALFAGAYIALTRGLFIIYLSFLEYRVEEISLVLFVAAAVSLLISILLYKHLSFVVNKVKLKLTIFYVLERIVWLLMPFATNSLLVIGLFTIFTLLSSLIGIFLVFAIYGSLTETDVREVTAKRTALSGLSSVLGFGMGVFLLAFLPEETKFLAIFFLGSVIGLLSTFLILSLDLSNLEGSLHPQVVEKPEKIFSTSAYVVVLMASGSLVDIVWVPYVMNQLIGPDWLAASMSLAGTSASILASLLWRKSTFKTLGVALALNALTPILIMWIPWPELHVGINAFASFSFTGANFIGVFLFARYTKWFGAAKSSILLIILGNTAMLIATPLGMISMGNYFVVFLMVFAIRIASVGLAFLTIPEVAVVPEDVASTYSQILYTTSISGYRISVHFSKETILTTLKLLGFSIILVALYVIYRTLWLLVM